jgi:hypothetical protein
MLAACVPHVSGRVFLARPNTEVQEFSAGTDLLKALFPFALLPLFDYISCFTTTLHEQHKKVTVAYRISDF